MNDINKRQHSKTTVQFDPTDYVQHLESMDLTEKEATEMLRTLWDIMVQFVDLGFTVNGTAESTSHSAVKLDSTIIKTRNATNTEGQTL